jgi:hypothetical protein
VIIHDHLRQTTCAHQKYDYNSRLWPNQCRPDNTSGEPDGRLGHFCPFESRVGGRVFKMMFREELADQTMSKGVETDTHRAAES